MQSPISRSRTRFWLGQKYFRAKRYMAWYMKPHRFATLRPAEETKFLHVIAEHQTPLYRPLARSDQWLQDNKVHNLSMAIPRLHHAVVKPGETFSYWRLLGKPSRRRGFKKGMQLVNGTVRVATGGGLCQLSNMIYWLTLHTPLTVIERWRHQYDVFPDANRTQPFGSGATCSYNYVDLQIRNDTDTPMMLQLWMSDGFLHGCWRSVAPMSVSYEIYEQDHRFVAREWGGFVRHNAIARRILDRTSREVIADEVVAVNDAYMMYNPFLTSGGDT